MRKEIKISSAVIKRLPKYYRYLGLIMDKGIVRVSSQELSEITGFTASQIRQDLNHFGGFGQQGYGYNVKELRNELELIIGIDKSYNIVIVGMGNIGQAIFKYHDKKDAGFKIKSIFDSNPDVIGREINGKTVKSTSDLGKYLETNEIDIAVISTPENVAQDIADLVVSKGVKGIWNFAPIDLRLPDGIVLEDVHLDESLYTLIYYIGNFKDYKGNRE